MIKLTKEELKEYILQGKHFKIQVTPGNLRLIQELATNCGRVRVDEVIQKLPTPYKYLYLTTKLEYGFSDSYFSNSPIPEISLVTLPTLDTQEDRWRFLLGGGKLICPTHPSNGYYFIQEGEVRCSTGSRSNMLFTDDEWTAYEELKQWYEDIPEVGILCWVDDHNENVRNYVELVERYERSNAEPYITMTNSWKYATPVTPEEVDKLIYKGK